MFTNVSTSTHLRLLRPSLRELCLICFHGTSLYQENTPNYDIVQGCFSIPSSMSMRCLVPWINYLPQYVVPFFGKVPDNKVHGTNMGPIWVLSARDGPHVSPLTLLSGVTYCVKWHVRDFCPRLAGDRPWPGKVAFVKYCRTSDRSSGHMITFFFKSIFTD